MADFGHSLERIAALVHVVLRKDPGPQSNVLLHLLALQDLKRRLDSLFATSRILERSRENPVLHVLDAFGGQRVYADELDLLLAALPFLESCLVGAMRAGIVMAVDGIYFREARQGRLHLPIGIGLQPLAVRIGNDLDLRAFDAF